MAKNRGVFQLLHFLKLVALAPLIPMNICSGICILEVHEVIKICQKLTVGPEASCM